MKCYLCQFNTDPLATEMNLFIEENIGKMHPDVIAAEIREQLLAQNEDMPADTIREHISVHTLNPVIRTGVMLRSLVDLEQKMKAEMSKTDAEGQNLGLDPKCIEAYLRLQNAMINLYKCQPTRLMYAPNNGGDRV